MLTSGRESVIPREKADNCVAQDYADNFFGGTSLISLDALPHDQTYTQEYFIDNILPGLVNEKRRI
jgi:hypothetical protein